MKSQYEETYHQLETKHYWFRARRTYILQELDKLDRNLKILDIGCSSGILLGELAMAGFKSENLYGIDISEKAISNCKNNGFKNTFTMDAQNINLDHKFDIIIASDCLEHLENDEKALNNWNHLLKQGGIAYIFVPAFMALWSEHDEVNMHYRRYTGKELREKLINNGFRIKKSGYWNFFLFLPILIMRILSRVKTKRSDNTGNLNKITLMNGLLFKLINLENKLLKHINFPVGVSTYCIAQKDNWPTQFYHDKRGH